VRVFELGMADWAHQQEAINKETSTPWLLLFVVAERDEDLRIRDLKFRSCLMLFREAASGQSDREPFTKTLEQFYRGESDARTLELIR
jgi:hypothetical protein